MPAKKSFEPMSETSPEKVLPQWITLDYVMGRFDPKEREDFALIANEYADREGLYLHKEAYEHFKLMWAAAKNEGISLEIRSAARNFEYQKGIWERKWNGATTLSDGTKASDIEDDQLRAMKILLYSSMPGASRHHWGTDIDLNSFDNNYFGTGEGLRIYEWLKTNAPTYGFCQPYISKSNGRTGYEEEKWHWSYIPLAKDLTTYCREYMSNDLISGFEGSHVAVEVDMLSNYILGLNSNCL